MTNASPRIRTVAPVWFAHLDQSESHLPVLIERFRALRDDPETRASHWHGQRYENLYIDRSKLPELAPVEAWALACARHILRREDLKFGFWFNAMAPGQRTTRHDHHEEDELLSAALYLAAPQASGDLLLHDDPAVVRVRPEAGLLVLFPPDLPHEVEVNRSASTRLSIAFNFGPAGGP